MSIQKIHSENILMHSEHLEKIGHFPQRKMNFLHLVLSAQNVSICIRMPQNVCRMQCANVLRTKLLKKWIHFIKIGKIDDFPGKNSIFCSK